jgi:hypothetical protein
LRKNAAQAVTPPIFLALRKALGQASPPQTASIVGKVLETTVAVVL